MKLIGMLDSPYVRRVAISMDVLGIEFEHCPISVFNDFDHFQQINPVVKAPTLICDDGEVLMDSSIILHYLQATHLENGTLWRSDQLLHECRVVCLALAACDKCVQILYERNLRPQENQYEPWMTRVNSQVTAAIAALDEEVKKHPQIFSGVLSQATISAVVAWTFIQSMLSQEVQTSCYSNLSELTERVEVMPSFLKYPPVGPGVNK